MPLQWHGLFFLDDFAGASCILGRAGDHALVLSFSRGKLQSSRMADGDAPIDVNDFRSGTTMVSAAKKGDEHRAWIFTWSDLRPMDSSGCGYCLDAGCSWINWYCFNGFGWKSLEARSLDAACFPPCRFDDFIGRPDRIEPRTWFWSARPRAARNVDDD